MKYKTLKKQIHKEKIITYENKHLIFELNNYISFYILKDGIKMKEFFKSIREHVLSGRLLSPSQFETLMPYLEKEPEMRKLGKNQPELTRQKVIERYTPLIRHSHIITQPATLEQFLPNEYLEETSFPIPSVRLGSQ